MAGISSYNPQVYTPLPTVTSTAPTGTNPTASGPTATGPTASETPDYSKLKDLVAESEKKVASAKKDLDAAEARCDKARLHYANFSHDAAQKYGEYLPNWPTPVRNELYQLEDFMTACESSVNVFQAAYNQALETHRNLMSQLSELIKNGQPIPTPKGTGNVPIILID